MMETLKGLQTPGRKSPCLRRWQKVGGCSGVGLGGWATRGRVGGSTLRGQSRTEIAAHISVLESHPRVGGRN